MHIHTNPHACASALIPAQVSIRTLHGMEGRWRARERVTSLAKHHRGDGPTYSLNKLLLHQSMRQSTRCDSCSDSCLNSCSESRCDICWDNRRDPRRCYTSVVAPPETPTAAAATAAATVAAPFAAPVATPDSRSAQMKEQMKTCWAVWAPEKTCTIGSIAASSSTGIESETSNEQMVQRPISQIRWQDKTIRMSLLALHVQAP